MGKGTSTNFGSDWFGWLQSMHDWGPHESHGAPKPGPSGNSGNSGGATGPTTTLTVTFNSEEAGYASAMGWYNARTGEAGVLFKNTNDDGWNAGVKAGDSRSLTVLQSDVDANNVGFFLIPDGANELSSSLLSSAMKFQVGFNGDGKIVIDRQYGDDVVLSGNDVLFSNQVLNKGDYDYVSGTVGTAGQTRQQKLGTQSDGPDGILGTMAWDDQAMNACGGTDRDFNDVVFTVTKSGGSNPPSNGAPTDINLSNASINENVAGGVIGVLSTVDPNAGDKHTYSVNDSRFEVVEGQLKLKSGVSLDYETQSSVQLKVTTTDQGGLGYSENFSIQVNDVNEVPANKAPTDINLSSAIISENVAGGVIGMLSTVDSNAGDKHTYSVSDSRFEVVDGQLKLKSGTSLDYESGASVQLKVTTTDKGGLGYTESFTIAVKDVNEAPTDISISNLSVNENASGAVVGMVTTIDPDAGNTHSYSVSGDDRFEVVGGQLKLKSGASLDYETQSSVQLKVTTTDQGGLSYSENFTVKVNDVNEVPPNSAPTDIMLSGATVTENVSGAVVGTLTTTDPNAGDTHTYKVDDARFQVVGGVLQLKSGVSLNYENASSVVVNVTTTDKGGLSYSENFTIAVKDTTEAPTDIVLSPFLVDENEFGAAVGTLTTIDDDAGDVHTYKVSDNRFEVVGSQLRLTEESAVDFETEGSVVLNVTSTDTQGNSFTKAITVIVNDLNEAPSSPLDDDPAPDFVASDAAVGATVGITVSAVEQDAGDSFKFSLSNNAGGMFAIDAVTGVVTVAGALEDGPQSITVRATDTHGEYSESDLVVQVGEEVQQLMAFGSSGIDTFLLDLGQEAITTLVGFNRTNDRLSFSGVADANANGSIGLNDLFAMVSGVSDFGSGGDIVVDFTTGASLVLQGAGTASGTVNSMSNLVTSPSTQYQFA